MTSEELVAVAAAAMSPTLSERARVTWATRIVDAIEPLIRADERERVQRELWPMIAAGEAEALADLRAAVEALPTIRHRTGAEPNVDSFGFAVDLQAVLALIDGGGG